MNSNNHKPKGKRSQEAPVKNVWDRPNKGLANKEEGDGVRKFKIACQQIEESVKRYVSTHEIEAEDDEEEKDENHGHESTIIERILGSYGNKGGLDRIQHHLSEAFRSGALICLVCIENIKRNDPIWNCEECYCSFHLDCIQKWAKDSIYLQSQAEQEEALFGNVGNQIEKKFKWFCPKCRYDYPNTKIPSEYTCFCGKQASPQFDPWLIPHSCGEKCKKKLRPDCGHQCLLLCHPGPCPPCPVMVTHPCYCQRAKPQMRRCSSKAWSCGLICSRYLACKQHQCQSKCHSELCPPCDRKSIQHCQCGDSSQLRPCADIIFQCDKVCGKKLSCGHHKCLKVCHSKGSCGQCPFGGQRTCPCGKKNYYDLPCTESALTCGDTCSKPLSCGVHMCAERCHKSSCPSCLQVRLKKCNCGAREKELACSRNFSCDIKCKRIRDCRKHACNRKCCIGDCPSCDHPCGKTLGCGQHKCDSRCHQMRCYPCSVTHQIVCSCGGTSVTVPCGREKKTPIPKCDIQCKKKPICHHPKAEPHNCHEGRCPRCKFVCGLTMQCNHVCPSVCHDAVPIKVVDQQRRSGPWERVSAPHIEIQKKNCPPCKVQVPNTCNGAHQTVDWDCSELRLYSCGRKCGRQLECSHHQCEKECHSVENAVDDSSQGHNCEPCTRQCSQQRPDECSHKCLRSCHPGPCDKCREKVKMQCHCGLIQVIVECHKWVTSNSHTREIMKCCTNQCNKMLSCGHRCQKQCHSKSCSSSEECRKKVAVRCNCKRIRKDVPCHSVVSGQAQVHCDEVCEKLIMEKKNAEEILLLNKKIEEEKEAKKELEEYERLMEGKRKKRKKKSLPTTENSDNQWWKQKPVVAIGILITSIILYLFLYNTY